MDLDREHFGRFGIELTPEIVKQLTGHSGKENAKWVKENLIPDVSEEEYFSVRVDNFKEIYLTKTLPLPGASQLVLKLKNRGYRQAIASGAPLEVIEIVVKRFSWREYLDELISADHVKDVGKPDPGIFLHAAEKLKVKPEECLVFEDAENGVVAAKRAGMHCIAVLDKRWSFGDFSQADLIVDSLEDKEITKFLGFKESDHINKKNRFIPEMSIKNTQLFRKEEYREECKVIEKELKKYLYVFPYEINNDVKETVEFD
jgi:HAD superfamily hydrolase (TIGR01509 family)